MKWITLMGIVALVGCADSGGGGKNCAQEGTPNMAGNWIGTLTVEPDDTLEMVATFEQDEKCIDGAWTTTRSKYWTDYGTISGDLSIKGAFSGTMQFSEYSGSCTKLDVSLALSGDSLTGGWTVMDCDAASFGDISLARQ